MYRKRKPESSLSRTTSTDSHKNTVENYGSGEGSTTPNVDTNNYKANNEKLTVQKNSQQSSKNTLSLFYHSTKKKIMSMPSGTSNSKSNSSATESPTLPLQLLDQILSSSSSDNRKSYPKSKRPAPPVPIILAASLANIDSPTKSMKDGCNTVMSYSNEIENNEQSTQAFGNITYKSQEIEPEILLAKCAHLSPLIDKDNTNQFTSPVPSYQTVYKNAWKTSSNWTSAVAPTGWYGNNKKERIPVSLSNTQVNESCKQEDTESSNLAQPTNTKQYTVEAPVVSTSYSTVTSNLSLGELPIDDDKCLSTISPRYYDCEISP